MKRSLSRIIKHVAREIPLVYRTLFFTKSLLTNFDGREQKRSYGSQNANETIYIIRPRTNGIEGLMALLNWVLQHVEYAERKGYIPVVDMINYRTQYWDGKNNIWELFFTQPSDIRLAEAYRSKKVVLSGYTYKDNLDSALLGNAIVRDKSIRTRYSDLFNKYFDLSAECKIILDKELENIPVSECIGVFLRGTDYVKLRPVGEPIQPDADAVIDKIEEYRKHLGDIPVFLVTEDDEIYQRFVKRVRNLYIASFDTFIKEYKGQDYLAFSGVLPDNKIDLGRKYLAKIKLLSMCRYFIGSIASGSRAALIMNNNNYKSEYIFDIGLYK